ncbi:hypothetical protein [Kingella potus]|nr:hypothetical protein [Kingella potus]
MVCLLRLRGFWCSGLVFRRPSAFVRVRGCAAVSAAPPRFPPARE